jgi:hypothetical protein
MGPSPASIKIKKNMVAAEDSMDRLNESITDDESPYDCIIWLGDMNYRINGVTGAIMHAMNKNMYEVLIDND